MEQKILNEFPPNYTLIKEVFKNCEEHKPIFAYGSIVYNPFNIEVTEDLKIHEGVHQRQQGSDIDGWWYKYLSDKAFREQEEICAYATQYALARKIAPRKISDWVLEKCAQSLSSELYGLDISYQQAESRIRNYAKTVVI